MPDAVVRTYSIETDGTIMKNISEKDLKKIKQHATEILLDSYDESLFWRKLEHKETGYMKHSFYFLYIIKTGSHPAKTS